LQIEITGILGYGRLLHCCVFSARRPWYRVPEGEFDSAVVTRVGDYLLASRCNAKTEADLKAMTESIKTMRKINGG